MKVGVLQFFSWPGRHGPLEDVYARALERIEIMDRGGFDAVWLAEHHFTTFSVCPSVHMLGTLAAARTKRLRIGTAVSLAALYHPLRLAEEVALLDMLSGGRVNWGAGRGFAPSEFKAFGVPPEESAERFREAVEIVLKAWTQERFSLQGHALHLRRRRGAAQAAAAAASADLDGGDLGAGHRLGGEPRLFHPDGPALLDAGARRQAPPLCARSSPKRASPMPAATFPWRGCSRWRRPRARPRPSRGAARNGWSMPMPDRSTPIASRCSGPTTARIRRSTMSTASSCMARRQSVVEQIGRLKEEIGLNYLMCAPLSRETFQSAGRSRCCRGCEHRLGDQRHVGVADLDHALAQPVAPVLLLGEGELRPAARRAASDSASCQATSRRKGWKPKPMSAW